MKLLVCNLFLFTSFFGISCTFNGSQVNAGTLSPTAGYETQTNISNGQYFVLNTSCNTTYNFTFCSNGGSASWDTQITILETNGTTQLAYNDDFCSLQSDVSWTATSSGTVYILITEYPCNLDGTYTGATMAYNATAGAPPNAAFTLSPVCGGAQALVTGNTGGVFSWNPSDPGDGSVLNTSTGVITGGVDGTTYTIDYTVCGVTSTDNATVTTDCWSLNGNALYIDVSGESCIQLTDEINNQTGCAWNGDQIDFAGDFSLTLDYYFGNNINGADGNTFTFQPSNSTACGQNGGQLGAGGLSNALAIEFDTYDNDNPTHLWDMACDHIAVEIDGNMLGPGAPYCGPVCAKPGGGNIDDGGTYTVDIVWNAATQQLDIYFDGNLRLSCNGDFVNTVFGGQNQVYWGATSATGGLNNQQYFCPSSIVIVLPVEMGRFYSECDGEDELITWTTVTENRVDHFLLEYTYDGQIFYPIETVKAIGNSMEEQTYQVNVKSDDPKQRYYRLKMVDTDGHVDYTDLIQSERCGYEEELISKVIQSQDQLTISTRKPSTISVYSQIGQKLYESPSSINQLTFEKNALSSGVYIINAVSNDGYTQTKKVYVNAN